MSYEINLQQMTVDALAQRCAEETERFRLRLQDDSQYCFELFRRAICERVELAWDMIYKQYEAEVAIWVKERVGFDSSEATIDHFINGAFAKMWHALTAEKFVRFGDIKPLLYYLKTCVYSVVVDDTRLTEPPTQYFPDESPIWGRDPSLAPEERVVEDEKSQAIWELVRERLHDDKERLILYYFFVLELKPQEIYDRCRNLFNEVDDIYRIKQNVVSRLRRDPEVRKLLGGGD